MNVAQAWTAFWAEQGPKSRCLANAPREILDLLDGHWHGLAPALPSNVLDLGCGAGVVGRELLGANPQLRVTGIDIALIPQSGDPRLELIPWTPMESLPFDDASFDAAVSQYGYEYGQAHETALEVARVLSPGAPFSFLIHHSESPLVAGMRLHKKAIDGLCDSRICSAFVMGDATGLGEQLAVLKHQCLGDPIVDQAGYGLRIHIRQDERRRHEIWKAVSDALEPERVMLQALSLCCVGHDDVDYWLEPLKAGFELKTPAAIRMRSGEPIAWIIEGRRRPAVTH